MKKTFIAVVVLAMACLAADYVVETSRTVTVRRFVNRMSCEFDLDASGKAYLKTATIYRARQTVDSGGVVLDSAGAGSVELTRAQLVGWKESVSNLVAALEAFNPGNVGD